MYVKDAELGGGRIRTAGRFGKNGGTRQRGGFSGGRTSAGGGRKTLSEDAAWERGFGQTDAAWDDGQARRTTASMQEELDALNKERSALVEERFPLLLDESNILRNKDRIVELNGSIFELDKQIAPLEDELEERRKAERQALIDSGEYRDANLLDLTWNSLKQGYYKGGYGQESYKDMMGDPNEKEKYEQILSGEDYRFLPDGFFEEALSGAGNMLGQQIRQWTDPLTIAAGLTGAGTAALAGQAGPQVLAPEEIITAPGVFFVGMGVGSAERNFEIEAGLAYNELRENGISEDTAKLIALFVGGGNAALELVQTDDMVKSFKIFARSDATQGFAQQLWQQLVQRMDDVAKETVQEVEQEAVSIGGVQVANKLEKGEWAYDLDEVTDRLKDTGFQSMLTYGLLNVPAGARNIGGIMSGGDTTINNHRSGQQIVEQLQEADTKQKTPHTETGGTVDSRPGTGYNQLADQNQESEGPSHGKADGEAGEGADAGADASLPTGKQDLERFERESARRGFEVFSGERASYAYKRSAGAQKDRLQKAFQAWGIDAAVVDGHMYCNRNGITTRYEIEEAVTINSRLVLINKDTTMSPKEVLGHEAFHVWQDTDAANAFIGVVMDNLKYKSEELSEYTKAIQNKYFGHEIEQTGSEKMGHELFAYIGGHINDGGYEDMLRPFLKDYDAVKEAWDTLVQENTKDAKGDWQEIKRIEGMKSPRLSEEGKQMVRQLQEADTKRKMPYARMGRDLLEMGIVPTDEMLEAMGMSREEARKYVILKQFEERD